MFYIFFRLVLSSRGTRDLRKKLTQSLYSILSSEGTKDHTRDSTKISDSDCRSSSVILCASGWHTVWSTLSKFWTLTKFAHRRTKNISKEINKNKIRENPRFRDSESVWSVCYNFSIQIIKLKRAFSLNCRATYEPSTSLRMTNYTKIYYETECPSPDRSGNPFVPVPIAIGRHKRL